MHKCEFILLRTSRQNSQVAECYEYKSDYLKNIDIINGDIVLYTDNVDVDFNVSYEFELFRIPFLFKRMELNFIEGKNLLEDSQILFEKYCVIAKKIGLFLANKYPGAYFFCSVYCSDFCLLIPEKKYDLLYIKKDIAEYFTSDLNNVSIQDLISEKEELLRVSYERDLCLNSERRFVSYNPMFRDYLNTIRNLGNINTDSIDRQQELSLLSSLVFKDLVEETHLYWLHESGDLKYLLPDAWGVISRRNRYYFELFNCFCEQASDSHIYCDWIWSLMFLTQTLLASIKKRDIGDCKEDYDKTSHINFFGFVPIIEDTSEEVRSFFPKHISKKFCHGFLSIPKDSLYNLPEYFPAYLHEFFHYIPPVNRPKRNILIFKLTLHSILFKIRTTLSVQYYDIVFESFYNSILKQTHNFDFDEHSFFDCDSMEYIERITGLFKKIDFEFIYEEIKSKDTIRKNDNIMLAVQKANKDCKNRFLNNAMDHSRTFALFFREIRSDIAMCKFFDIELRDYIRLLAEEPLFSAMDDENCADSTIMRFGFMCRYLSNNLYSSTDDWFISCNEIIDKFIIECPDSNSELKRNYFNLKKYVKSYFEWFIEQKDNCYTPKNESLLENLLLSENIIEDWEDYIQRYSSHLFSQAIKDIYKYYRANSVNEKLKSICGIRFLFRDLNLFHPDIDIQEE